MESLVILMAVDDLITETAYDVVEQLRGYGVPVVFVTEQPSDFVLRLMRRLDLRYPFIAEGGASLCVPKGYFPVVGDTDPNEESDWQVLPLRSRDRDGFSDAVRLLMALYRVGDDPVLFVGLGDQWKHRALLRAVDVPVIVRNDRLDQTRLLRTVPDAYLTKAVGAAGCVEAILGSANHGSCIGKG